jgi:DNA-directed RNA polymerase subunit alpha
MFALYDPSGTLFGSQLQRLADVRECRSVQVWTERAGDRQGLSINLWTADSWLQTKRDERPHPVLKVTYKVEATRVEQRTDFDKLVLDVETKQSMLPRDAVASAGKTLVELFGLARELNVDAEGIDIGPSPADAFVAEQLSTPIEQLDLTVRSYNCLKREGIHTVGELIGRSEADLLDIRNFGAKSIDEVKVKLVTLGLALKDSPPGFDPGAAVYFSDDEDDDDLGYVEDEQL